MSYENIYLHILPITYIFNVAGCNGISFLLFIGIRFNFSDLYFY